MTFFLILISWIFLFIVNYKIFAKIVSMEGRVMDKTDRKVNSTISALHLIGLVLAICIVTVESGILQKLWTVIVAKFQGFLLWIENLGNKKEDLKEEGNE